MKLIGTHCRSKNLRPPPNIRSVAQEQTSKDINLRPRIFPTDDIWQELPERVGQQSDFGVGASEPRRTTFGPNVQQTVVGTGPVGEHSRRTWRPGPLPRVQTSWVPRVGVLGTVRRHRRAARLRVHPIHSPAVVHFAGRRPGVVCSAQVCVPAVVVRRGKDRGGKGLRRHEQQICANAFLRDGKVFYGDGPRREVLPFKNVRKWNVPFWRFKKLCIVTEYCANNNARSHEYYYQRMLFNVW